jgi:hypothetical protein
LGSRAFASGTTTSSRIARSESTKLSSERSSSVEGHKDNLLDASHVIVPEKLVHMGMLCKMHRRHDQLQLGVRRSELDQGS